MRDVVFLGTTLIALASLTLMLPRAAAQAPAEPSSGTQGVSGGEPCKGSPICAWSRDRNTIAHEARAPRPRVQVRVPVLTAGRRRRRLGRRDRFEGAFVR